MSSTPFISAGSGVASGGGVNPYIVGGVVFALLLLTMFVLLSIGRGREHS